MPIREAAAIPIGISGASASAEGVEGLRPLLSAVDCGPTERAELHSISQEKDLELRQDALRSFASRQEAKGRYVYAATAYELLLSFGEDGLAQRRLKALRGGGDFGDRAERMIGDFFHQATSPEMLGGMAAGSLVGSGLQALTLGRLLGGEAAYFTRGLGARGLASGVGFLGEVPAVVLASKGLHQAQGGSVDWGAKTLGHELSSMALSLGLLKSGSALGHRINAGFTPGTVGSRVSAALLPQATAGTALFAAHRLESILGLRPRSDAASALFDSALMLLQFHVGGRLLHAATGGALSRTLGELQVRSRLSAEPRFPEGPEASSVLEFAGVLARRGGPPSFLAPLPPRDAAKKLQAATNHMSALADNGGADGFLNRRLVQRMSEVLGVAGNDARLQSIADNYWNTPFHYQRPEARGTYFDMLSRSELVGTDFLETGREIPAIDLMQSASLILRRAMEMNPFRGGSGSFYDFLTQVAFEQTLQSQRVPAFDALVHTLTVKQSQSALEDFFHEQQFHSPFDRQRFDRRFRPMDHTPVLRALEAFPVSDKVRWWLSEYLLSYNHGIGAGSFRNPIYNHYYVTTHGKREALPLLTEGVFQSLRDIFADPKNHLVWQSGLEQLVRRAEHSPVPMLYFDRFFKLLGSGDLPEKISELIAGTNYNPLEVWQRHPINGTVYTGYVSDPVLNEKFGDFYRALPELLHPKNSSDRLAEFRLKAEEQLEGRENFDAEQILELLYHRPTARAAEARQAILDGQVGLEVLTHEGMEYLMKSLRPDRPIGKLHDALYLPASRSPTGLPYIAILQLDPRLSREEKVARAVFLAAYAVHEYDHHLHVGELDINQRGQRLKAEMRGWLEENLYLLTQGEKTVWEEAEVVSPTGFGVYLRSLIERAYLHEDNDYLQKQP